MPKFSLLDCLELLLLLLKYRRLLNKNITLSVFVVVEIRIRKKVDDDQMKDLKDIREAQEIIDEVVVKTSDDVALIKKRKEENNDAIKLLESKIDILTKELEMRVT